MSYKDYFRYDRDDSASRNIYMHLYRPEALYTAKEVTYYDRNAADDIAKFEAIIEDLKEYRLALARRFAELETMPFTYRLYITRKKSYTTKKVSYTVRLARVLPDGKELDERREQFSGTERRKAFDLFEQLKRERPGIEAIQETDKAHWE